MFTRPNLPSRRPRGAVSIPSPRAEATPPEARIEDYLDHVCAPLVGRIPYAERRAVRAEARQHLDMLIAAYTELGSEPAEAVEQALKQFGAPHELAQQWVMTAQGRRPDDVALSVELPMATAFGWFGMTTLFLIACLFAKPANGLLPIAALCAPVWAGLLTGLLSRGRHTLGTFYALAVVIPLTLGVGFLFPTGSDPVHPDNGLMELPLIQFVLWMPLGCAASAVGGWLRGIGERLRRPLAWE